MALGAAIVARWGWGALWVYGFALLPVIAVAVLGGRGGELIQGWSRRRFRDP